MLTSYFVPLLDISQAYYCAANLSSTLLALQFVPLSADLGLRAITVISDWPEGIGHDRSMGSGNGFFQIVRGYQLSSLKLRFFS